MLTPKLWRTPRQSRCSATLRRKRSALTGGQRASLAFSGRALAPLPHPPRASTKTKTWLWMVGVGLAFAPECRAVRDRTEKPQDEHGAMPPAPGYPKYVYGHSATGPRVMNPAFHFVSICVFSAPRKVLTETEDQLSPRNNSRPNRRLHPVVSLANK